MKKIKKGKEIEMWDRGRAKREDRASERQNQVLFDISSLKVVRTLSTTSSHLRGRDGRREGEWVGG